MNTVLRQACPSDSQAIARVHVASSQDAYAPLAQEWQCLDVPERATRWASSLSGSQLDPRRVDLVATLAGVVIAFISAGPARRRDLGVALEVYVIHVLPQHRGRGVGSQLWNAACALLRGEALSAFYIETFAELRCCSFYEAHGGKVMSRMPEAFHGSTVTKLVYVWPAGTAS
jgi:GNAT superfamily N-acetyltransferase